MESLFLGILLFKAVLVSICLGVIPAFIAQSKGRSFVAWWFYGAMVFIAALPHSLIIKPDTEQIEREQLQSGNSRKCPFCAEIIKIEANVCRFCGRDLPRDERYIDHDAVTRKLWRYWKGNTEKSTDETLGGA
jgi:hypothetical protein